MPQSNMLKIAAVAGYSPGSPGFSRAVKSEHRVILEIGQRMTVFTVPHDNIPV
jgi:hypothetical protein